MKDKKGGVFVVKTKIKEEVVNHILSIKNYIFDEAKNELMKENEEIDEEFVDVIIETLDEEILSILFYYYNLLKNAVKKTTIN
ncbi:MAG: hypothetical protein ACTSQS_18295, partial [Promethearchaeota archaeon]